MLPACGSSNAPLLATLAKEALEARGGFSTLGFRVGLRGLGFRVEWGLIGLHGVYVGFRGRLFGGLIGSLNYVWV